MSAKTKNTINIECDKIGMEEFMKFLKSLLKLIKEFNSEFFEFIEEQKKQARDLWNLVTRYNVLNSGPLCVYPIITKEEISQEIIVMIQERTTKIHQSMTAIKVKFDKLPQYNKILQKESEQLDWNPVTNLSIKGSLNHKSPSQLLEDIADILFHYDVSITCMHQYFEALNLRDTNSYQNLMNSFNISKEIIDFVNEFQINCIMLFN